MKSRNIFAMFVLLIGISPAGQARDLFMAPLGGWVNTRSYDNFAVMTIHGIAAQGMFEKMPESSALPPSAACIKDGVTKAGKGIVCSATPNSLKPHYECEIYFSLESKALTDFFVENGDIDCGEDDSFLMEQRKRAKKQGYWWDD
jgi:hypothetical protein